MSIAISRSPQSSFRLPRADIAFCYFIISVFLPATETHLYRSGGFALEVTWRKRVPFVRTAGVFDPRLSHAGYSAIDALREGKRQIHDAA